jgi:hypothetical protein
MALMSSTKANSEILATQLRYQQFWLIIGGAILTGIMALALWPMPDPELAPPQSDKVVHLVAFAFLFTWFAGLLSRQARFKIVLALMAYGVAMEILQSFTPTRFMSAGDLVADALGLGLGWLISIRGGDRWAEWLENRFHSVANR